MEHSATKTSAKLSSTVKNKIWIKKNGWIWNFYIFAILYVHFRQSSKGFQYFFKVLKTDFTIQYVQYRVGVNPVSSRCARHCVIAAQTATSQLTSDARQLAPTFTHTGVCRAASQSISCLSEAPVRNWCRTGWTARPQSSSVWPFAWEKYAEVWK